MCTRKKRQMSKEFIIAEYNVIANEYTTILQTSQNVIVINLAISIGLLAAIATLVVDDKFGQFINTIMLSWFSSVGLLGSLFCIHTLHILRRQLINLQKKLLIFENKFGYINARTKCYYKPLHITLSGFWLFLITFVTILAICIIKLIIPQMLNFLSVSILVIIISLCLLGISKILDICYVRINQKLIK